MIFKIFAILIVLFLVYLLFFKKGREPKIQKKENELISDEMMECKTCGTFVSKNEAIHKHLEYYCSKECEQ